MMKIRLLLVWASAFINFAAALPAYCQPQAESPRDPFQFLIQSAVSAFHPVSGTVLSVKNGLIKSDITNSSGLAPNMRVFIYRNTEPFLHPITGETVMTPQVEAGLANAALVDGSGSTFKIIRGEAKKGDALRMSSGRIRVLFCQTGGLRWTLAEEYYLRLKDTDRFDLIDKYLDAANDEEVLAEARRVRAQAAIVISGAGDAEGFIIRQRLLWVEDGSEITSSEMLFKQEQERKFTLGEKYFSPSLDKPVAEFELPYIASSVASGDFDGDGLPELAVSTGAEVAFYTCCEDFKPLSKLVLQYAHPHISISAADVDGDGRDELALKKQNAAYEIFKYSSGVFEKAYLNLMSDPQSADADGFNLSYAYTGKPIATAQDGLVAWEGADTYLDGAGIAKGRFIKYGAGALTLKNTKTKNLDSIIIKHPHIMALYRKNGSVAEMVIASGLPASSKDFAVIGGRLIVLSGRAIPNPFNLFFGKTMYTTKLSIYKIEGTSAR